MKRLIHLALAFVALLGGLLTSMLTNDPRWFLVGYPTGMLLMGTGDTNRRGAVATMIAVVMFITLAAAIVARRSR